MRLLPILAVISLLASCRTTKHVTKDYVNTDSLVQVNKQLTEEAETWQAVYKEMSILLDTKDSSNSGVTIIYEPSDTVYRERTVTIDNGRIEASGQLKSVQISNSRLLTTNSRQAETIDSLSMANRRLDSMVNTRTQTSDNSVRIVRDVERVTYIPWWMWLLLAAAIAIAIFKERLPIIKHMKFILAIVSLLALSSCTDFHNSPGVSVWSEGTWILPLVGFLGSGILMYLGYKGSRSGSVQQTEKGVVHGGNVSIWKSGRFWFGIVIFVATIVTIVSVVSSR